jgi:hypothetical protein
VVYSHLPSLLFCSLWDIFDCCSVSGDVEDYISRRPCGALLSMYLFYAFALLEPILDSVVIKNSFIIYTLLFHDMCCDILMILLYIYVT